MIIVCYIKSTVSLFDLKSGSDIRGTAIATAAEAVNLDAETVQKIGGAFCTWLSTKTGKTDLIVAVGHDSRLTGETLKEALIEKFKKCGMTIYDCGLASTPAMYTMTKHAEVKADGAIMITASHHPKHKNGLKFFTADGGLQSGDIDEILHLAAQDLCPVGNRTLLCRKPYVEKYYAAGLVDFARTKTGEMYPLEGFKIVVDAGNGAGGFYVEHVLKPLGASTEGSQFLNPDGNFSNHAPNPEDSVAMQSICNCVKTHNADLGIIFDTDVDRAAIVGPNGEAVNRNALIALASAILLEESAEHLKTKTLHIVTDSVTSDGLTKFIEDKGGSHRRYKRGYQNVIGFAKLLNEEGIYAPLAIETSGHAAFLENGFLDDGAYLVTRILIKMAQLKKEDKKLLDLIAGLEKSQSEFECRIRFTDKKGFKAYGDMLIKNLTEYCKTAFRLAPSTYEGVRANIDALDGWFLLRQSVHDPNMVLNIESGQADGVVKIAQIIYTYLSAFCELDMSDLENFIIHNA